VVVAADGEVDEYEPGKSNEIASKSHLQSASGIPVVFGLSFVDSWSIRFGTRKRKDGHAGTKDVRDSAASGRSAYSGVR
jgi:hypothetical protein